ncbi:MAG: ribosome-associated translation inhibitor RaiA [Clostridiales bacterium]|nr:ribosome-associated translation inhibitor RaiA [Clostridiales bacterium]
MKFTFTDKKVTLPARVHAYAEKKLGKLDRYFKADTEASVVFSVEKGRNNVEVTIRSGGTIIRVAESTSDMFVSIDAAVASIERRLRKNKARLGKRLRKDAFVRGVGDSAELQSSFAPEEPEEEEFKLVRVKHFFFSPMTVEEAILQMNLLGHTFFAFRNEDLNGTFSVVYRRYDGGYGLLEDDA